MAREVKRDGSESSDSGQPSQLSVVESIRLLAASNARSEITDDKQMMLFLQSWWSRTYNRPLKDPILLSYSLEELLYEFYDKIERKKAEEESLNKEEEVKEEVKEKEVLDWAEQEEKKELEAMRSKASEHDKKAVLDPSKDPKNIAWMEEQLRSAKVKFGETFGEDIEDNFNE